MASDDSTQSGSTAVRLGTRLGKAFERVQEQIRDRAYHIFLSRDAGKGDSLTDWLDAQRELLVPVELILKDQKKNIVVEGNLKGFKPKEIEVEVGVHDLRVFGSHSDSKSSKKSGETQLSSETIHFYQAISLPCEVETSAGQATLLKNGKLKITLPKKLESRRAA